MFITVSLLCVCHMIYRESLCRNNTQVRMALHGSKGLWLRNVRVIFQNASIKQHQHCTYRTYVYNIYSFSNILRISQSSLVLPEPILNLIQSHFVIPYFGMWCGNQCKMLYLGECEVLQLTGLRRLFFWTIVKKPDTNSESTWPSRNGLGWLQ